MRTNHNVKKAYDKWAASYDLVENPTRDLAHQAIKTILSEIEGKEIIEAGCGTGINTQWLSEKANSVVSFDLSIEMLKAMQQKMKTRNVMIIQYDITGAWPFPKKSCDIVTINLVLEHIKEIDPIFIEAYNVLRKDGILWVCELHPEKQKKETKATFHEPVEDKQIEIDSYYHSLIDYLRAAENGKFRDISIKDWYDANHTSPPRLLSILSRKAE